MFHQIFIMFISLLLSLVVTAETTGEQRTRRALPASEETSVRLCQLGLPGIPGRDGRDGRDAMLMGAPGLRGKPGPRGAQGVKGDSSGTVYTRWGRSDCPKSVKTQTLYSGVMAGEGYEHSGGGSNYLCLPLDPIFDKITPGVQGYSKLHGTEYEIGSHTNIPSINQNHDAPCAVCYTESRGSHIMIPARNVCPSGWTLEYKGYLMSAYLGHKGRTQFICVDGDAEARPGSHANENGALLHFVESSCGSLPCPPYANGNELTCAVCTK